MTTLSSVGITHVVPSISYTGPYPRSPLTDNNHSPFDVTLGVHLYIPARVTGSIQINTDWGVTHSETLTLAPGEKDIVITVSTAGKSVKLWWPNGLGNQNLYNISATFTSASIPAIVTSSRRIGFRVFALVTTKNEGKHLFLFV